MRPLMSPWSATPSALRPLAICRQCLRSSTASPSPTLRLSIPNAQLQSLRALSRSPYSTISSKPDPKTVTQPVARVEPRSQEQDEHSKPRSSPRRRRIVLTVTALLLVGAGAFAGIVPSWVLYLFWPSGFSDYCCCYECCFECCCPGCNGACECC